MSESVTHSYKRGQGNSNWAGLRLVKATCNYFPMGATTSAHFFREWRKHHRLKQQDVADALDVKRELISQIETGKKPYSQKHLERAAKLFDCQPAEILYRDPADPRPCWAIIAEIPVGLRATALRTLESFIHKENEGVA